MNVVLFSVGLFLVFISIFLKPPTREVPFSNLKCTGKSGWIVAEKQIVKNINGEECSWIPDAVNGSIVFSGTKIHDDGTAENLDTGIKADDGGYWLRPGQTASYLKY